MGQTASAVFYSFQIFAILRKNHTEKLECLQWRTGMAKKSGNQGTVDEEQELGEISEGKSCWKWEVRKLPFKNPESQYADKNRFILPISKE